LQPRVKSKCYCVEWTALKQDFDADFRSIRKADIEGMELSRDGDAAVAIARRLESGVLRPPAHRGWCMVHGTSNSAVGCRLPVLAGGAVWGSQIGPSLSALIDLFIYMLPLARHSPRPCRLSIETPLSRLSPYSASGYTYRIRAAAAGIGSTCGLGASPIPGLRESARAAPRARKYRRAAHPGCSGARWSPGVRQQ
jgi:hypothetical protein